jgi:hypothetical protein
VKILLFFVSLFTASLDAFVPFNPIIHTTQGPNHAIGDAYFVDAQNPAQGVVGWIDAWGVTAQKGDTTPDRVLAIRTMGNDGLYRYRYADPTDLSRTLPKGLFCWFSTNSQFKNLQNNATLLSQKTPIAPMVLPYAKKTFAWNGKSYANYDPNQAQYTHPSQYIADAMVYDPADKKNHDLDRFGFFHDVVGVTEQYFRDFFGNPLQSPSHKDVVNFFRRDARGFEQTERSTIVGGLSIETIGSINKKLQSIQPDPSRTGKGSITLIDGYKIYADAGGKFPDDKGFNPNNIAGTIDLQPGAYQARREADIRRILADPLYKDAVFQVASTHALLEGHSFKPEGQLTSMLSQPVQGEEIAIATAGASVYRKYLMTKIDIFKKIGGYNTIGKQTITDADMAKIEIGWHPNVAVTSGFRDSYVYYEKGNNITYQSSRTPPQVAHRLEWYIQNEYLQKNRNIYNLFNSTIDNPSNHKVNLALCAAHNMGNKNNQTSQDKAAARSIVRAMYKGTLELAALQGKQKVVLTLLGAGAFAGPFGNDILGWIVDALRENLDTIARYGLDVTIINYPDLRPHRIRTREEVTTLSNNISNLIPELSKRNYQYAQGGTGVTGGKANQPTTTLGSSSDLAKQLGNLTTTLMDLVKALQ